MQYSNRFFLYAPLALLLILAAAVMGWWQVAASAAARELDTINGRELRVGVRLSFAAKRIEGFPFRIDVVLDHVKLETHDAFGSLAWEAEHAASHRLTYGPGQTIFEAAGRQLLEWHDAEGHEHRIAFEMASAHASAATIASRLERFDLDLIGFKSKAISSERMQLHFRNNPSRNTLDVYASADRILLGEAVRSRFGTEISQLRLAGSVRNAPALAGLMRGEQRWRDALDIWRQSRGNIAISGFEIGLERFRGTASGQLALDGSRRLAGTVTLRIVKAQDVAGAASASGPVSLGSAISNLAGSHDFSTEGPLVAPVRFRDGEISVGTRPAGPAEPLY